MQPHKLIRYAAIILVLFYFSTSYGFLDTCPKRNSLTDKCYEQDDKHIRSEARVADVPRREVRSWREEDRHVPGANAENRRALDRNNNRISTFQRERTLTFRRERNMEVPNQLNAGNDRFRSFNTISLRSDRINTDRRNAGNSIQKPILKTRTFDNNLGIERSFDKTARRHERRFSRINNSEGRRSRQPNSNEFRQHEATKERKSVDVFREQFGIHEAETRIQNSERITTRQDKNGVRGTRDVRNRQADGVLTERRGNENDSRRSSVRTFDDRRRAVVRSAEISSRFEHREQIPSARDGRQSSDHRESVLPDARLSRSGREERTSSSLDNRQLATRREIIPSGVSSYPSTFRREERSSYTRDNQQLSLIRREHSLPNIDRNAVYSRSISQQHGFRREPLAADIRQDTIPSVSRQERREGRQLFTRRLAPSPVRRYSSSVFRREESRDDRLSSSARHDIRQDTISSSSRQEQREGRQFPTRRLVPSPVRRYSVFRREESRDDRLSSTPRDDIRQDTISSSSRREHPESRQLSTRRLAPSPVRRYFSSVFRREDSRDDRVSSSTRRELILSDSRRRTASASPKQEERSVFTRNNREISSSNVHRDAASRREERISSARNGPQFLARRERVLGRAARVRQEQQPTFTRNNRQTIARRLSPSDIRRDTDSPTVKHEERTSSTTRLDRQSLKRQGPQRDAVVSSTFRKEERSSLARDERGYTLDDNRRGASTSMFRREITRERRGLSASPERALSNARRDITSSRFRQEKESIHHERTINEDRRQQSNTFPTRENRSASRTAKNSIRREFPTYYERRRAISSTSGVDRKQFSIRDERSGKEIRGTPNFQESKTNEQRSINRQVLKVADVRENERRQYPSHSAVLLSNDRRRVISPARLHVNSRRLLDDEQYSRTSSKSETRDNSDVFGHKQIQLADKISQDWSNLAKTLLIALTLFQILAKTYPKKAGFQNLLHNSLGCVKQKVQ